MPQESPDRASFGDSVGVDKRPLTDCVIGQRTLRHNRDDDWALTLREALE